MKLSEAFDFMPLFEEEDDIMTISAIKAQTGTKEKLDRFLGDYGVNESPPVDELVVVMTVKDEHVAYEQGTSFNEMVYTIDTSNWEIETIEGDFGNTMLVATFTSVELGKLQDKYLTDLGDDGDLEEGDVEFEFVLSSDVGDVLTDEELNEMQLGFTKYIPTMSFQEVVVGYMTSDQFLQLSNGLPIMDRDMD